MLAVGERRPGAFLAGGTGTEWLEERPDPQRPCELMGQSRDRVIQLKLFQCRPDSEDVEVEDATEAMVGDEQHGPLEDRRLRVDP